MSQLLTDPYQRVIRKLRVSLLDTCNFRCTYCMPADPVFQPRSSRLSSPEIVAIARVLVDMGIEEIRLTGGEPTLRPDLMKIANDLSTLSLRKLGMTSNGYLLQNFLPELKESRCQHLNISLDSLNRRRFQELAKFDGLEKTLGAILKAHTMGFQVKINTVMIGGINDNEIEDFIKFSADYGIEVRFLELMAIGQASKLQAHSFISADQILRRMMEVSDFVSKATDADATARVYRSSNGAQIGLIAPVTQSFCGQCSRWRLTADGQLRACLMSSKGVNLRGLDEDGIRLGANRVLGMKPRSGDHHQKEAMHAIGG